MAFTVGAPDEGSDCYYNGNFVPNGGGVSAGRSEGCMELTVQNVYGLLLRSKLMGVEDAKVMYTRWQAEARDQSTNLGRFASWMVQNRYVTDYQATLLARGHADGFFLNEYKILDRLGKGRMAGVHRGSTNSVRSSPSRCCRHRKHETPISWPLHARAAWPSS